MSHFEYRDEDGGHFTAQPLPGVPYVLLKTDPEGCAVPLDRLEEAIAGLRDMARQTGGQTEPVRPPASTFTATERQFLRFALGLAADLMANRGDEFDDEDHAALDRFRRMTTEEAGA